MQYVLLKCRNVVAMSHFKMLAMEHGKGGWFDEKNVGKSDDGMLKKKD